MKQLWITLLLLCAVFLGQAWAEPPQKLTAVPELQRFLYSQRGHFEFSKPSKEWIVNFPEHREYETALEYLLNMGYADSEEHKEGQKPMIIIRPNTPLHVLLAAYAFNGAVQREVNQSQRQEAKATLEAIDGVKTLVGTILIQVNGLWGYGIGGIVIVVLGLFIGVKIEHRRQYPKLAEKLAGVKSGKTFEDYKTQVDTSTKEHIRNGSIQIQSDVQKIIDPVMKEIKEARAELWQLKQGKQPNVLTTPELKPTNGKGAHAIATNATDAATNPADIPEWKTADRAPSTNGNGVHVEPIVVATPIPIPKTEDEPTPPETTRSGVEAVLEPTELLSVLDKKARDEQKIRELHDKIKRGDDGEPTVVTKRPKTIPLQEGLPEPKKEMSAN